MKKLWIILIAGTVLRIILSSVTFHPDILAFKLGGEVVASGKILNLYDYSNSNIAVLNYPPAIYWFHGIFNFLLGKILGVGLLVKIPYLIFDLLIALLLLKLFTSRKDAMVAFLIWMFNPISLYATYMMGQFDIIPTFFTVLSIYFVTRSKLNWAAFSLGSGIAFKFYPIFLVIPLIIIGRNFWDRVRLLSLSILPYIMSIIPYLPSSSFRSTALLANQSSKSLYANIPVSGGEAILLFPAALLLFYFLIWNKKIEKLFFWRVYLIPLLLFFTFTHYHPQWLIWVTPFLILDLVRERFKNLIPSTLILLSWVGLLFFFDPSLTVGIFTPLIPTLHNLPSIWTTLHLAADYNISRSFLQTIFAAASLYLIYEHFPKKTN